MPTIFSKIIQGELPCYKIFEDQYTFAFLDIKPHNLGHTLIVPKIEVGDYKDVPEPYYSAVFQNAKTIGRAIQKATDCLRVGLVVHGMGVPDHFHLHLIPMFQVDDLNTDKASSRSEVEMKRIQQQIVANL
jgi:histidine triad (HIT) family protein